jgi:predicted alpha/beta hydrolase family esterase
MVAGLRGSGPAHWQTLWLARSPAYRRVPQEDWTLPCVEAWAAAVDRAIRAASQRPVLVAHGFGCLAVLRRLRERRVDVAGAMFVAPREPAEFGLGLPEPLEMPTMLVASRDDPSIGFAAAQALAWRLGSHFVDAGKAGHIDAASGYGPWPKGERLLEGLLADAHAQERRLRAALALIQ